MFRQGKKHQITQARSYGLGINGVRRGRKRHRGRENVIKQLKEREALQTRMLLIIVGKGKKRRNDTMKKKRSDREGKRNPTGQRVAGGGKGDDKPAVDEQKKNKIHARQVGRIK